MPAFLETLNKYKLLFTCLLILVLLLFGVIVLQLLNPKPPPKEVAKNVPKVETKQPVIGGLRTEYQVTGFIINIDTKNSSIELKTFGDKGKTYQLKVNSKTTIYQFKPIPTNKSTQTGTSKIEFKDLQKGYQLKVITDKDPSQETSLTSLVIMVL